jgi:uncharacterized protein (TIGR02001 family)
MKKFTQLALAAALATSASVATAEISANVTLASEYVWRGISQTQNNGAIQGGFDYEHESGFYAGVWGSNVDFDSDTSIELDYYAGYGFNITEDLSVDVGITHYTYPDESGLDFKEGHINLGYKGFSAGYAANGGIFGGESTDHFTVGYETELPQEVALAVSYNLYDFKSEVFGDNEEEYKYWSLGVSKSFFGLDFGLTYTDTDLDSDQCETFAGNDDYCDSIVTVSMSKSM